MSGDDAAMNRSQRVVKTLHEVDPTFGNLVDLLYGPGVDASTVYADVFAKKDVRTPEQKRQQLEARIGLASNYVGLTAGTAGLASAAQDPRLKNSKTGRAILGAGGKAGKLVPKKVTRTLLKHPGKVAGGALALQGANLAGDAISNRVLGRSAANPKEVTKMASVNELAAGIKVGMGRLIPKAKTSTPVPAAPGKATTQVGSNGVVTSAPAGKRRLVPTEGAIDTSKARSLGAYAAGFRNNPLGQTKAALSTPGGAATGATAGVLAAGKAKRSRANKGGDDDYYYAKSAPDLTWQGEFTKFDEDKRLAFGWASVVEKDGVPVVDRQGDYIHPDDMETAAYVYVQKSRKGGDMHRRTTGEDGVDAPHHVSDLVESVVFTKEKIAKMGLPDTTPVGWWVGFKVHDDETWDLVKKGGRSGFSIHGRGKRADYETGH